jgi:hypothetical protein
MYDEVDARAGGLPGTTCEPLALPRANAPVLVAVLEPLSVLDGRAVDPAFVGSAVVFEIGAAVVSDVVGAVLSRAGVLDGGSDAAGGTGKGRTPRGLGNVVLSRRCFGCGGCTGCPGRALAGAPSASIAMSAIAVTAALHAMTRNRR